MKNKDRLTASSKFRFIQKELNTLYGKDVANDIVSRAEKHCAACKELCKDASEGEWMHLNNTILPTVSIYKALLEVDPKNAIKNTHDTMMKLCGIGGKFLNGLLRLPGMKSLFMKLLPKMALKMFGKECGFDYTNLDISKDMLQMDMTFCPYCKYTTIFNCTELTPIFCESDSATYGNMPGIRFERTQTLGTGGAKCDFKFIRYRESENG